jgi:hypothetical protein
MVKDWTEIDMPWVEIDAFADIIIDKTHFLDILDQWKIEYMPCSSGEFTHRMKCPLPEHGSGNERTASCFISQEQNKFYCFGCNCGGNIIDFVRLYTGKPFYEAVRWLAAYAKITSEGLEEGLKNIPKKEKRDPEKMLSTHIFRSGVLIRNFLNLIKGKKEYEKWCNWADKRFEKLDKFSNELTDNEWEIAKMYYDKISNHIKKSKI